MITKIREIWKEILPKIFEVAQNEPNSDIQALCEDNSTCTSEGMLCLCTYLFHARLTV